MPTDLELAENAATAGPTLAQLAKAKEANVLRAVAANPNAPREVLFKLVEKFPDEVLGNAALPLLRLESPNLWEDVPYEAQPRVAAAPSCPPDFAEWAITEAGNPDVIQALIGNEALPLDLRRRAFLSPRYRSFHFNRIRRDSRPLPELERLLGSDFFALLRRAGFTGALGPGAKAAPDLSEAELRELAGYGGLGRELALDHPNTPVDLLPPLAADPDGQVRARVARHPRTPEATLRALARDVDLWPRGGVARNPKAPPDLLRELVKDKEVGVAKGVAGNPAAPADLLLAWVQGKCPAIARRVMAETPTTPAAVQRVLAGDKIEGVRSNLAANAGLAPEVARLLAKDPGLKVRLRLAANPHVDPAVLAGLAKEKDAQLLKALARNRSTPAKLKASLKAQAKPKTLEITKSTKTKPKRSTR